MTRRKILIMKKNLEQKEDALGFGDRERKGKSLRTK